MQFQVLNGDSHIVTRKVDLVLVVLSRRVKRDLGRPQGEYEPSLARIYSGETQNVRKES
jgi:hypothetical protein